MFGRLLPQEPLFFDFFEQHAQLVVQAAQAFLHFIKQDPLPLMQEEHTLKEIEHQADDITHRCIETLHKCFITPFQQNDIVQLITRMDDVIDSVDEAWENCLIYQLRSPKKAAQELAYLLLQAAEKIEAMVKCLHNRRKHVESIRKCTCDIDSLEKQADDVFRRALGQLFDEEPDIRLVIKWKSVYECLEQASDCCKHVSNIIQGIMLEYD